jgi:hypothetical protein
MALKMVVLPELGLPQMATSQAPVAELVRDGAGVLICPLRSLIFQFYRDQRRLSVAQRQTAGADLDFHRVPQRSISEIGNHPTGYQTELQKSARKRTVFRKTYYCASLSGDHLVKVRHIFFLI